MVTLKGIGLEDGREPGELALVAVLPDHQVVVALALGTGEAFEQLGVSKAINKGTSELVADVVLGAGCRDTFLAEEAVLLGMSEQGKQRLSAALAAEEELLHDFAQSGEGTLLPGLVQGLVLIVDAGLRLVIVPAIQS